MTGRTGRLLVLCLALASLSACGIRSDPVPPQDAPAPAERTSG